MSAPPWQRHLGYNCRRFFGYRPSGREADGGLGTPLHPPGERTEVKRGFQGTGNLPTASDQPEGDRAVGTDLKVCVVVHQALKAAGRMSDRATQLASLELRACG